MAAYRPLPFFIRAGKVVQCSAPTDSNDRDFHFDLLSFISIAEELKVDFVKITWQPALGELGTGATSTVQQAQLDAEFNLAFKRSTVMSEGDFADTNQQEIAMYKALVYELIALELLSKHPNVIDLLGITWEIENEQVWPVLLTERSIYGSMADFLPSEPGAKLNCREKLGLCADVARACQALHTLGIVHGDIKQENVLVFKNGESWTAKLIDFGYSCLGTSENEMVNVAHTRPWQAPEHSKDQFFQLHAARRMDVYSFGMLVCRTFLSDELTSSVGKVGRCDDSREHLRLLEHIDSLKASSSFLDMVLRALQNSKAVDKACVQDLRLILKLTLQHDPQLRAANFDHLVPIFTSLDAVDPAPVTELATVKRLPHQILDIGSMLADLDDTDYILHCTLVDDLKRRATRRRPCACFQSAVHQLWLCYEIGFGVTRDPQKAAEWLSRGTSGDFDSPGTLKKIDEEYDPRSPIRLIEKLGYDTNLQFDPIELYQVQGRLDKAVQAFRDEVSGREESLGRQSKSYISQLSTLAIMLSWNGNLEEAEIAGRNAAKYSQDAYGADSLDTISAQNYLANILFQRRKWSDLEQLQLELIPRKENHKEIGAEDPTTLNSKNSLLAAYCFQGQYHKCIELAREVTSFRKEHLGEDHPETLVTLQWLCRALLENGDFLDLERLAKDLVAASERACGKSDEATVERKEILAAILLGEAKLHDANVNAEKLEESMQLILEVLDECDKEDKNLVLFIRAQTTLVCVLALQGRFGDAALEIEQATTEIEGLMEYLGSDYVEILRFQKVQENVTSLRELGERGEEGLKQADLVREKIAHRWKL